MRGVVMHTARAARVEERDDLATPDNTCET
jgi:hypothetical protein